MPEASNPAGDSATTGPRTSEEHEHLAVGGLCVHEISVAFGGLVANSNVTLKADRGEIVGLIGPNGAGKTTFLDAITGFAPSTGDVFVGDLRLDELRPHRRQRAGLARTWQAGELFNSLSVAENIEVAQDKAGWRSLGSDFRDRCAAEVVERTMASLALLGLADAAERKPRELSLGNQRLVGVARALASDPTVVLLDEPAAGLDAHESRLLGQRLKRMAETGVATVLIDHDIGLVFEVSDRVYVLDFGSVIASGTPDEVRSNELVVAAYLGAPESLEGKD